MVPRAHAPAPHHRPGPSPDADLDSERDHLSASRAALTRMRDHTSTLDSSAAGDWVSRQFLKSAIIARIKALADDPVAAVLGTQNGAGAAAMLAARAAFLLFAALGDRIESMRVGDV